MKMVSDARRAWRWFSVQVLAVLAVLPLVWHEIPPELRAWVPEGAEPWIVAAVAIGGIVGRLVDQGGRE